MSSADDDGPNVLRYADASTEAAVDDTARRVAVAPGGWRALGAFRVAIPSFAGVLLFSLSVGLLTRARATDLMGPMILWGVPIAVMGIVAVDRHSRRITFDVAPHELRMASVGFLGTTRQAWPRSAVQGIRVSRIDNRLYIRIAGENEASVYLGPDLAANELVMHELIAAQTAVLTAPPGTAVPPPPPTDEYDGVRSQRAQKALLVGAAVLGVIAIILALCVFPPVFGCYTGIAAVGLVGIAFGTQKKDLWP